MPSRREASLRHAVHYGTVLRAADDLYLQGGEALIRSLKLFDVEWQNLQLAQAWTAAHTEEDEEAARLCSQYPYVGEMLIYLRLRARDRIKWGEAALIASRRVKDQYAESAHLHKLALALIDLGEFDRAIDYLLQAVAINREIKRHEYEASDLGALGLAYAALGKHRKAIKLYRQALAIYHTIDARWGEGIYLSNLADSYTAMGRPRVAIKLHEQALKINREARDHRSEGYALGNLGKAYAARGEHSRALELFEQSRAIARDMADPQSEGYALFGSSLSLWEIGKRGEAIANARRALEIFERTEDCYATRVRERLDRWQEQNLASAPATR